MFQRNLVWMASALLLVTNSSALALADIRPLVLRLPPGANAVIGIDLEAMLDSPIAAQLGWQEKYQRAFSAGMESLPPHTLQAVTAANLDMEQMALRWQAVVLSVDYDVDLAMAATRFQSTVESRGGLSGFPVGDAGYIVEFNPRVLGGMAPVTRQTSAHWIRDAQAASQPSLSTYLTDSLQNLDNGRAVMVLSLDLQDAMHEDRIRQRLEESELLPTSMIDLGRLAKLLVTLRGIVLEVQATDALEGAFHLDFAESPAELVNGPIPDLGRRILIAALGDHGVAIDELADWDCSVSGNRLTLTGELQIAGYRRIMSLANLPLQPFEATTATAAELSPPTASAAAEDVSPSEATASLEFFQAVDELLADLSRDKKESQSIGQIAMWLERYADKIDRLPSVGVDEALLQFGAHASEQLREAAGAVRGIGIESAARAAQITPQYFLGGSGYRYGGSRYRGWRHPYPGWGYGSSWFYAENNYEGQRRAVRQEERAKGFQFADSILNEVRSASGDVRRQMSQKYGVNF